MDTSGADCSTNAWKKICLLVTAAAFLPALVAAANYNLGKLAGSHRLEVFNRRLDQAQADGPDAIYLNSADNYGVAWLKGVEFSKGTIKLELRGRNRPGQSFIGIVFHGQDNKTFDAVYLRPFNFQAAEAEHRRHSIQYISLPEYDWSDLRKNYPSKYESALTPAPAPESWVNLKLVLEGKTLSAFVNGSDKPALRIELLNDRNTGKLGLWVGNGSDGWFRNLMVTPAAN